MNITLGLHLDTAAFPRPLHGRDAVIGETALGPLGMAGLLEQRLGLRRKATPQAVRIAQQQQRLSALGGRRFYSRSFAVDSWSTAKRLLAWRDELALAGWSFHGTPPTRRLADLAAVEAIVDIELAPGLGERMRAVLGALPDACDLGIASLCLIEPEAMWPPLWRALFRLLQKQGVHLSPCSPEASCSNEDSLLRQLQRASLRGVPLQDKHASDESLVLLAAPSRQEAAEALAAWLDRLSPVQARKTLLIRNGGCRLLDQALRRKGLPRLGHDTRSPWREAVQTLTCAFALRWAPIDVGALLEFLSLRHSPIPRHTAFHFTNAILQAPGVGGPLWKNAKQEAVDAYTAMLSEESTPDVKAKIQTLEQELEYWLEAERHSPESGMPAAVAQDISLRVEQWSYQAASRCANESDARLLAQAGGMAGDIAAAIAACNVPMVTKAQLDRILDAVLASGVKDPGVFAEASSWPVIDAPGQLFGPIDTVVWWNFNEPDTTASLQPWSAKERAWLAEQGCLVDAPEAARARIVEAWRRPLRFAASRLVLVQWESDAGGVTPPHPYQDELAFLLGDNSARTVHVADLTSLPDSIFLGTTLPSEETPSLAPPSPNMVWAVATGKDWRREEESFSSLDMLLRCPLAWVFRYWARLKGADVSALPKTNAMVGTLCHAIIESLFQQKTLRDAETARAKAFELYDELVEQMAAPLLERGSEVERLRYRELIGRSVHRMCLLFEELGLEPTAMEASRSRGLPTGNALSGKIDLLLNHKHSDAIQFWDLKWAGTSKYKREELQHGKALQLAVYSWLLSEGKLNTPPGAFFMLAQQELLSVDLPGASERYVVTENTLDETWSNAFALYQERLRKLHEGEIEASGLLDAQEDELEGETQAFRIEPNCQWCAYSALCGVTL